MRATIAKIYIDNLRHNLKSIRARISKDSKMCVAVKADAYGHGAVRCAQEAISCGADFLAVATVEEGTELREAGISVPILVLSLCDLEEISELISNNLTPLVFDPEYIQKIEECVRSQNKSNFAVHLAVDTGMGRIGCLPENAVSIAKIIDSSDVLRLGGMCTHFAAADSIKEEDIAYTEQQFAAFLHAVDSVKTAGINPGIRHCANSALTLARPEMHLDMCRPGIIVYGYYPGDITQDYLKSLGIDIELKPVMALVSKIVAIRPFESGKSISYGHTWTAQKPTDIGVLTIGYGDGMFRRFSQAGVKIAVNGKEYPICGRICMDQCMIDLGANSSVPRWSEAIIFGPKESGALQSAQEIADATGTISYEITCGISKRVQRVFIG